MKIKTSFTLSKDLIEEIDKLLGRKGNRSTLVEQALRNYLAAQKGQNADPNTLNKADDNVNAQPIERVVQEVVQSHFEIEPEIDEIVWFKSRSNREIRLLEINQDTFPTGNVLVFPFAPSPPEVPLPVFSLIRNSKCDVFQSSIYNFQS